MLLGHIRNTARSTIHRALATAGVLRLRTAQEDALIQTVPYEYIGDVNGAMGDIRRRNVERVDLKSPPPRVEIQHDVYYSDLGMAWTSGKLHQHYSIRKPSIREALAFPPSRGVEEIDAAYIVESDVVHTYGDWVHNYLAAVLVAYPLRHPLVMPAWLAAKPYAQAELRALGISYRTANPWVKIKTAHVLRKWTFLQFWDRPPVIAFRRLLAPERITPDPGSITYLGRYDIPTEAIARRYPSEEAAEAVKAMGGTVLEQKVLNVATAAGYGRTMETVIGDHGSGLLNIMFWEPKTVIELVTRDWWTANTLFVAREMGIRRYGAIYVDGLSAGEIKAKLETVLARLDTEHINADVPAPESAAG